ncbi:hypothetical protein SCLCIDRAFT_1210398 [Scleroderma citrinum Foug A]|uniref:Uncharacterized protein n=1 Tax=Scleroderma citrinum Foug A TaxID=1036808 RepID=A0A0C3E3E9_9AGAM|nr:hypothetical protein SCLCIDRAFT_1210398 [Scleroderma citrinum Foug A]
MSLFAHVSSWAYQISISVPLMICNDCSLLTTPGVKDYIDDMASPLAISWSVDTLIVTNPCLLSSISSASPARNCRLCLRPRLGLAAITNFSSSESAQSCGVERGAG